MANPVLVNKQLEEMRTVMKRMRQTQFTEEQSMSHLQDLANNINGSGRKVIFAKKRVGDLRAVSKRMQAVHETSDPVLTQKLNKIGPKS
jgi:hypothetical protein